MVKRHFFWKNRSHSSVATPFTALTRQQIWQLVRRARPAAGTTECHVFREDRVAADFSDPSIQRLNQAKKRKLQASLSEDTTLQFDGEVVEPARQNMMAEFAAQVKMEPAKGMLESKDQRPPRIHEMRHFQGGHPIPAPRPICGDCDTIGERQSGTRKCHDVQELHDPTGERSTRCSQC